MPENSHSRELKGVESNRREYIRVSADFQVTYRVTDQGEFKQTKPVFPGVSSFPSFEAAEKLYTAGDGNDHQILELLLWLDWKFNFLIKTLTEREDNNVISNRGIVEDISASGMRIRTTKLVNSKADLALELILPILPYREIFLIAEVVRSQRMADGVSDLQYVTSITFKDIKESDREHIIRYVLKRQLQLQREKSNRNDSDPLKNS